MVGPEYVRPDSLTEALDFLARKGEQTTLLAGGSDVVVDLKAGTLSPAYLLDISRLKELEGIALADDGLRIGAGVTLSEIRESQILRQHAPALEKCAHSFASQQIRNIATSGGNVAHCSPCGDTVPPLLIHRAKAVLASKSGTRQIPVADIASGPYACALPPGEIIVCFLLEPAGEIDFADFRKIGRRRSLAIARLSLAAMARRDPRGRIDSIRIALGACTPTPRFMTGVEDFLLGRQPTESLLWEAGAMLAAEMISITGRRSSAVYKEPAVQGLFVRMCLPLVR